MNNVNLCPICKTFILSNYCAICEKEIDYTQDDLDKLKGMFGTDTFNNMFGGMKND